MKFRAVLQYLLKDKKVRGKAWKKNQYIELVDNKIVDEQGLPYSIDDRLYKAEWELYKKAYNITSGDKLISKDKDITQTYRVVTQPDGRFMIIDSDLWFVLDTDIEEDTLEVRADELGLLKVNNFSGSLNRYWE